MEVQISTQTQKNNATYGIINKTKELGIQISLSIPEYLQKQRRLNKIYSLNKTEKVHVAPVIDADGLLLSGMT